MFSRKVMSTDPVVSGFYWPQIFIICCLGIQHYIIMVHLKISQNISFSIVLVSGREWSIHVEPFIIILSFEHTCWPSTEAGQRDPALANGCELDASIWLFRLLHHLHASHLFGEFTQINSLCLMRQLLHAWREISKWIIFHLFSTELTALGAESSKAKVIFECISGTVSSQACCRL